jgi:hypothetical protein
MQPQPPVMQAPIMQAPITEPAGSESFINRVTWLSCVHTAAVLCQPLMNESADIGQVQQAAAATMSVADTLFFRARQVERGITMQAPEDVPEEDDVPFE